MDIFDSQSARPMLIGSDGEPFDSPDHVFELKLDGERSLAYVSPGETVLVNRHGRPILQQFPELAGLHAGTGKHRCIIDGELIVNEGRKPDFEFIKQRALSKNQFTIQRLSAQHPVTFVALDLLYLDGELLVDQPLTRRQEMLKTIVQEHERLAHVRSIEQAGLAFYELVKQQGLEGIIAKRKDSTYLMGKRTKDWMKIKNWLEDDFVVCGFMVSESAAVVSLILGQYNTDDQLVYKGRVTLGKNRSEFDQVNQLPRRRSHPFAEAPKERLAGVVEWLLPSLVCRVGFLCWTTHMKLRQPFYKALRPDVNPKSVREYVPGPNDHALCTV